MPICLVVFIGLVAISGFVAAAVPIGEHSVNTTVSLGVSPDLNGTAHVASAVPIGELGVNTTVSRGVSDLNRTAATPDQNATPVVQLSVSPVLIDEEPILLCTGNVTVAARPVASALVYLTIDDYSTLDCTTDENGAFSQRVRIGPGRHSVVANVTLVDRPQSPAVSSPMIVEIPVQESTPVVQLSVSPFNSSGELVLLCTGNVTVAARPVSGATVHLTFDDYGILNCTTDENGTFFLLVGIGPGRHSVVANVTLVDHPQSPALSARLTAEIPGGQLPLLPLAVGVIALLTGGTGLFFWRRGRGTEKQPEQKPEVPPPSEETPVAVTEDLRETAGKLAGGELREGIEAVYQELLVRLDQQQPGAHLRTRTPREIQEQFQGTSIATPITAMTTIYEAVVYSGRTPVEKDRRAMIDLFVAVFSGSA